jgi:hypothetical protein
MKRTNSLYRTLNRGQTAAGASQATSLPGIRRFHYLSGNVWQVLCREQ